jgi:hypothetical protein
VAGTDKSAWTPKFLRGARVRWIGDKNMTVTTGTIGEFDPTFQYIVDWDGDGSWVADEDDLAPLPEDEDPPWEPMFSNGDRVVCIGEIAYGPKQGEIGTVIKVDRPQAYEVLWDEVGSKIIPEWSLRRSKT